jgi:hypothetical protein
MMCKKGANMETKDEKQTNFFQQEAERLETERAAYNAEHGYRDFLSLPRGVNIVEFFAEVPVENAVYKDRLNFHVSFNGKEYDWSIHRKSPLYREIISSLSKGVRKFEILRSGSGLETRYEVEAIEE